MVLKNFYLFQVFDLKHQFDHVSPKKIQLIEKYRNDTNNARIFVILIRHRENMMVSDGIKITEIKGV